MGAASQGLDPEQARIRLQREFNGDSTQSKDPSIALKEQGNAYYKNKWFPQALECYSEAIVSCDFHDVVATTRLTHLCCSSSPESEPVEPSHLLQ